MAKNEDSEIQRKLLELEAAIVEEPASTIVPASSKATEATVSKSESVESDLHLIAGVGMIVLGIFLFLNHVRVGTGFLAWLGVGGQGFGLILIPLIVGIGFLCYDYKKRIGWLITSVSLAAIMFGMLSHLVMTFPSMSLLGVIMMLVPFAFGGALILKALKTKKQNGK